MRRLLSELEDQETDDRFEYSIVVVDNDGSESARRIVESFSDGSKAAVRYYVEAEQNIALARNKAVEKARGDFIAFIDDDEVPGDDWLSRLYSAVHRYGADGVLGPVLPYFEKDPPGWVLKGRFFDRPTHPTGSVLEWRNTRTGNVLLRRAVFADDRRWFNPALGSGGEDREFFRRKIGEGRVFVWCNEAPVFETVPPKRWKRSVLLKRALLRGKMALNSAGSRPGNVIGSVIAVVIYTCCLPVCLFLGHHVFMKYLIKDCDHLGKVLAFLGIQVVKEKYVEG